jgi:predicted permease
MISEGFWRQVLASDNAVLGRTLRVNGRERTVVGIMPASFRFPEAAGNEIEKGIWLPMQPTTEMLRERGFAFFSILAKRAPNVGLSTVQSELGLIAKRIADTDTHADHKLAFRAQSYSETITGPVRGVFLALIAALGLVLLIVCANVANLLIARGLGRQHEFAVRAALGCGQRSLAGLMIAEAATLSVLGSVLGLVIAYWITGAIHGLPPGTIPRAESIQVDASVLFILAGIAIFTTTLSALLPASMIAKSDAQAALRTSSRSVSTNAITSGVSAWLVGGEVALSALLLIAAGLLFRTLWGLEHTRLGFEASGVTSFVAMPADASGFGSAGVSEKADPTATVATTVYLPLLDRLRHTPGFQDVALVTAPPFSGFDIQTSFSVVGWPRKSQQGLSTRLTAVSGRYQELMGTAMIRGRGITELDVANAPFVAVINEALARKYFAGKDPLGQQLNLGGQETGMIRSYTIVGVMGDQIDTSTSQPPGPVLMLPYQQIPAASLFYQPLLKTAMHFVVKARANAPVAASAHAVFHRMAPDLAVDNFLTMRELVDQSNNNSRLGLYLIGAFAGLAVLMVIIGLYGVLSQVVSQRCREFGLRMALGATREHVARMVILRGSAIVAAGLVVGLALALSFGGLIKAFLFGVKPLDTATYVCSIAALFLIGAAAALIPAWRAASLEPVKALREE